MVVVTTEINNIFVSKIKPLKTMDNKKKLRRNQISLDERSNIHKCEICDKEFKNNDGLKKHINVVHNFEKEHQCVICQKKI